MKTVGAYMAMFSTNVWPRQTLPALLLGSITSAVGITVLAWAINVGRISIIYGMMALTGHGIGMRVIPASLHGLAYFPTQTSAITLIGSFAMPFGGTVSLTIMSTVFNNKSGFQHTDPKRGIMFAFISLIPFMWLCVVLVTFFGNVWIMKDEQHEVVNVPYLWSLIARKKLVRERRMRGDTLHDNHGAVEGNQTEAANVDPEKQQETEAS